MFGLAQSCTMPHCHSAGTLRKHRAPAPLRTVHQGSGGMLTWRYLSRLTKPWQQGSWQQVDVRNESFPACIPEFAVPSSVWYGYGAWFSRHLPPSTEGREAAGVNYWRGRWWIIQRVCLRRGNGAPSWAALPPLTSSQHQDVAPSASLRTC